VEYGAADAPLDAAKEIDPSIVDGLFDGKAR
jgi:hypothetical protein